MGVSVVEAPVINQTNVVRHDPEALSKEIMALALRHVFTGR